jgi:hypothetical protein
VPHIYEVPTHLQVEDSLIAGLTPKQLLRLFAGGSLAYGIWDQAAMLPPSVRLVLALIVAALAIVLTLVQPGGRPLDQWLFAALCYALMPRRWSWRRSPGVHGWQLRTDDSDWADLAPEVGWQTPIRRATVGDGAAGRQHHDDRSAR